MNQPQSRLPRAWLGGISLCAALASSSLSTIDFVRARRSYALTHESTSIRFIYLPRAKPALNKVATLTLQALRCPEQPR